MQEYIPITLLREMIKTKLRDLTIDFINLQLPPGYKDYIDVEVTAANPAAPQEWREEAIGISQWFYGIFQQLEAKIEEIENMTEEELLNFRAEEWIDALPRLEL